PRLIHHDILLDAVPAIAFEERVTGFRPRPCVAPKILRIRVISVGPDRSESVIGVRGSRKTEEAPAHRPAGHSVGLPPAPAHPAIRRTDARKLAAIRGRVPIVAQPQV